MNLKISKSPEDWNELYKLIAWLISNTGIHWIDFYNLSEMKDRLELKAKIKLMSIHLPAKKKQKKLLIFMITINEYNSLSRCINDFFEELELPQYSYLKNTIRAFHAQAHQQILRLQDLQNELVNQKKLALPSAQKLLQ